MAYKPYMLQTALYLCFNTGWFDEYSIVLFNYYRILYNLTTTAMGRNFCNRDF